MLLIYFVVEDQCFTLPHLPIELELMISMKTSMYISETSISKMKLLKLFTRMNGTTGSTYLPIIQESEPGSFFTSLNSYLHFAISYNVGITIFRTSVDGSNVKKAKQTLTAFIKALSKI